MAALGSIVYVDIRRQKYKAKVVPTPFYKRSKTAGQSSSKTI
jgi:glycine cleavage system aminomethyltransferase T